MEIQSARKINWLIGANLGSGVLACLLCFPSLVGIILNLIVYLSGYRWKIPILGSYNNPTIIYRYILYVSPLVISISFLLGQVALIAGLITRIFMKGRQSKKIGLAGIVLGILGIAGKLSTAAPCGAACKTQLRYLDGAMNWK